MSDNHANGRCVAGRLAQMARWVGDIGGYFNRNLPVREVAAPPPASFQDS